MNEEEKNNAIKIIGALSALIISIVTIAYMFGIISNNVSTLKEDVKNLQQSTMTSESIRLLVKDEEEDLIPKLDLKYYTKPQFDETNMEISNLKLKIERMKLDIDELKNKHKK